MNRRTFLSTAGAVSAGGFAGCLNMFETQSTGEPPVVEERPDAVYYPTHVEGMQMIGMEKAGEYSVGLMYSFPHRFWTVTGDTAEKVTIQDEDSVHLMATLWDDQTKTVLPVSAGLTLAVKQDGETVAEKPPWPMLSQNMGFHYGDNYALNGDGTYEVDVSVSGMNTNRSGAFAGKFDSGASTTITFEYSQAEREEIMFERLDDKAGEQGAVEVMQMEMVPTSAVPAKNDLPGQVLGTKPSGDAKVITIAIEDTAFTDGDGTYIAVSPRTPYNRIPLTMMSLSGTLKRDGTTIFDDTLPPGIHPTVGYHYGAVVEGVQSGDAFTVTIDAPPQVSRHEGYETAFLQMSSVEFTVP